MRYAVIADVHANLEALNAVLSSIDRERIDHIVCLGDIVGYNADPDACVSVVRDRGIRAIAGNHDRAALGVRDTSTFGQVARDAIEWTKAELSEESRDYLRRLPSSDLVDDVFFMVHGALHPEPNDEIHLSNEARVARSFSELTTGRFGARICFFGHTHLPAIYEHRRGAFRRIELTECELSTDAHYLINPGSVGQSRDGDYRTAYALFDADARRLTLRRVDYDARSSKRRAFARGLAKPERTSVRLVHWLQNQLDHHRDLTLYHARRWARARGL